MKILGVEHIGIAVESLAQRGPFWEHILNLPCTGVEEVEKQGVKTAFYEAGNDKIELLESLYPDSSVAKFIQRRGPGIHHICLEVEDIQEAIQELKEAQIQVINDVPAKGAEGHLVVFIHPRSTGGVLVELTQKTTLEK
jgi:methylmalonyl-CoA/ethylmalonyl-CoA epimerase